MSQPFKNLPTLYLDLFYNLLPVRASSASTASPSLEPNPAPSSSLNSKHVVEILQERGLIESITSENLKSCTNIKAYCGFDPAAESLHLSYLIGLIVLMVQEMRPRANRTSGKSHWSGR